MKCEFGAFYYSEPMEKLRKKARAQNAYFKPLIGKPRKYNMWVSWWPYVRQIDPWYDAHFLGFGWHHHSEKR
jgi:hypothetical protein